MNEGLATPVLFIIFNRPDTTQRVFECIRAARPRLLFIAADGPRKDNPADEVKCKDARAIVKNIDWTCDVKTLFRDQNLGCREAVSSAIDWFFENVEQGIILEDDCLPHPDFFPFCETLLEKYKNDNSVMHISGGNFQFGEKRGNASYYFSHISHIWGWASWRRAWKTYDVDMKDFPEFLKSSKPFFINDQLQQYWLFHFRRMYRGADTWDYQWSYAVMKNHGYCIIPNTNLISNIGFGEQATHSFDKKDPLANMATGPIGDLVHPATIGFNLEADRFTIESVFPIPSLYQRILAKIRKTLKQVLT